MLLRGEEVRTKSGIGGVMTRLGGEELLERDDKLGVRSQVEG